MSTIAKEVAPSFNEALKALAKIFADVGNGAQDGGVQENTRFKCVKEDCPSKFHAVYRVVVGGKNRYLVAPCGAVVGNGPVDRELEIPTFNTALRALVDAGVKPRNPKDRGVFMGTYFACDNCSKGVHVRFREVHGEGGAVYRVAACGKIPPRNERTYLLPGR